MNDIKSEKAEPTNQLSTESKHEIHPVEASIQAGEMRPELLNSRDMRRLRLAGYDEISKKFKNTYLIRHLKTGKMAEIKASSSVHACTLLGWNPKKVQVIACQEFNDQVEET